MKKPFLREIGPHQIVTSSGFILACVIVVPCNRDSTLCDMFQVLLSIRYYF